VSKARTASHPLEVADSASALDLHAVTLLSSGKKGGDGGRCVGDATVDYGKGEPARHRANLGEEPAEGSSGESRTVGGEEREKRAFVSLLGGTVFRNLQESDLELLKRRRQPRSKPFP
jgi:hypothetical protein